MNTALVTGATSGIGLEFAKLLAKNKYNVVLVARDTAKLQEIAKELTEKYSVQVTSISKDLSSPISPQEIYDQLKKDNISIDILINNAGFGTHGKFVEIDLQRELEELQINIVTLTHLTKLFARDMVKNGQGKILNVASTAAFLSGPFMAVYYASKAYVLHFSEAIASELKGTGVTVTALCPGPTKTNFAKTANADKLKLFQGDLLTAENVAKEGYESMMKGKSVVIVDLKNKLLISLLHFVPRNAAVAFLRMEQKQ